MDVLEAASLLQRFTGTNITRTVATIEMSLRGATIPACSDAVASCGADSEVLCAASTIKQLAGQINVAIHALGILRCLPRILEPGEVVEYVSLGAGNTGRPFDLETNLRIAEFKFIRWQGGAEVIRQNALFKDFYLLAEHESEKSKFLYVLDDLYPKKFFLSRRTLSSVLSRHVAMAAEFGRKYGEQYRTVRDYYVPREDRVVLRDVSHWIPELRERVAAD